MNSRQANQDFAADYFDNAALANNPFASSQGASSMDPFAASSSDCAQGPATYVLTKSGPALEVDEFEKPNVAALEVMILWGDSVLHASHLCPPRSFYVGEEEGKNLSCDFFLPSEKLGATRIPLVVVDESGVNVVLPAGASGYVEVPQLGRTSLRELVSSGRAVACPMLAGAHRLTLAQGARARICVQDMVFLVNAVQAGRNVSAGAFADRDWTTALYVGLSSAVHVGLLAAVAAFMPPLGITDSEGMTKDQLFLIQQYLNASAERESAAAEQDASNAETGAVDKPEGGTGRRSAGAEGSMGSTTSKQTGNRYAIAGPRENQDIQVARAAMREEASRMGMIGLLNAGVAGDLNAPTAPWGGDVSLGNDPISANGNMWGPQIGESHGAGALGLSGTGEGGGGSGAGIGLGYIGTVGHGAGLGNGQGFGDGMALKSRGHNPQPPRVAMGTTEVNGRLPREIIQRIVRQNYGRFRMCYENGLRGNPSLQGRVAVRFVIGRDGTVSNVSNGGSDMPDPNVIQCVVRSYYGLSFPQPENGIVTVVYPIAFSPGG